MRKVIITITVITLIVSILSTGIIVLLTPSPTENSGVSPSLSGEQQ